MNLLEAMEQRHAIRAYTDEPVDQAILDILRAEIDACNQESGLHIQMTTGLDDAFLGLKTHYGRFTGVHNAIALIGRPVRDGAADGHGAAGTNEHDAATETATGTADPSVAVDTIPDGAAAAWHKAAAADESATDPCEIALQERVGYYGERGVARRAAGIGDKLGRAGRCGRGGTPVVVPAPRREDRVDAGVRSWCTAGRATPQQADRGAMPDTGRHGDARLVPRRHGGRDARADVAEPAAVPVHPARGRHGQR